MAVAVAEKSLITAFKQLGGPHHPLVIETLERGKTIFFQGIPRSGFTFW